MTKQQRKLIKAIEGYTGDISDELKKLFNSREYESFFKGLKFWLYTMLLSSGEITDDEYSEIEGLVTELRNTTF